MATAESAPIQKAGALLTDVLAYCAAHPYDGEDLVIGDIAFQQHYNEADGTRTVSVLGDAPDVLGVSTALLEWADPQFISFSGGLLVLDAEPRQLLYRPLYLGRDAQVVMFQRVCTTCRDRRKVPDWSQGLDPVYGEPKGKPCPECCV
jgi:hypothetical protein